MRLVIGVVISNVQPEFAEVGRWPFVFVDLPVEDDAVPVLADVDAAGDVEFFRVHAANGSGVHRCQISDQSAEISVSRHVGELARALEGFVGRANFVFAT